MYIMYVIIYYVLKYVIIRQLLFIDDKITQYSQNGNQLFRIHCFPNCCFYILQFF